MKNERTVYTTRSCFPFTLFSSCNRKNENGYNGSYFYFSFFVWGLEKRKRMLGYPFSIFYYEIEKRKTKGRYILAATCSISVSLQWRHNERDGVSNHRRLDCSLRLLFRRISRKHQSSVPLAFVRGIHQWLVNSPHKGTVTWRMLPFDDVIMWWYVHHTTRTVYTIRVLLWFGTGEF